MGEREEDRVKLYFVLCFASFFTKQNIYNTHVRTSRLLSRENLLGRGAHCSLGSQFLVLVSRAQLGHCIMNMLVVVPQTTCS